MFVLHREDSDFIRLSEWVLDALAFGELRRRVWLELVLSCALRRHLGHTCNVVDGLFTTLRLCQHGAILDLIHLHFNPFGAIEVLLRNGYCFLGLKLGKLCTYRLELVDLDLNLLREIVVLVLNGKDLV